MKRMGLLLVAIAFTACPADMWIPIQAAPRTPTAFDHVQFLDEPPSRPFTLIGIITPPKDEYETEAEAVKVIRKVAAKHGADAVFIESQTEGSGWSFHGTKGGSITTMSIRAKAIAWQ